MTSTTIAPQGCTNLKLRQLVRGVTRLYDAEMAPTGLKTTQYSLLSGVLKLAPVRPGDLARALRLEPSTLTRNLRPLVAAGWIELGAGTDARSRMVRADRRERPEGLGEIAQRGELDNQHAHHSNSR